MVEDDGFGVEVVQEEVVAVNDGFLPEIVQTDVVVNDGFG